MLVAEHPMTIWQTKESMDLPSYMTKKQPSQAVKDKEKFNKEWLRDIKQLEREALCRGEIDEVELHGLLKYKLPYHIKVRPKEEPIDAPYHYEHKEEKLTEA